MIIKEMKRDLRELLAQMGEVADEEDDRARLQRARALQRAHEMQALAWWPKTNRAVLLALQAGDVGTAYECVDEIIGILRVELAA